MFWSGKERIYGLLLYSIIPFVICSLKIWGSSNTKVFASLLQIFSAEERYSQSVGWLRQSTTSPTTPVKKNYHQKNNNLMQNFEGIPKHCSPFTKKLPPWWPQLTVFDSSPGSIMTHGWPGEDMPLGIFLHHTYLLTSEIGRWTCRSDGPKRYDLLGRWANDDWTYRWFFINTHTHIVDVVVVERFGRKWW